MKHSKSMKRILILLLIIMTGFSLAAFDNDDEDRVPPQEKTGRRDRGPYRKLESWYHMFSIGMVASAEVDGISFETDVAVALDFLRFYIPMSRRAILGVGINGTGHKDNDSESQINFYLYSASLQYYFKSIGDGFFLRADVGGAKGALVNDSGGLEAASNWGFGYLIGLGYALPISRETSLLFYGTYRSLDIEGINVSDFSFQVGWLW